MRVRYVVEVYRRLDLTLMEKLESFLVRKEIETTNQQKNNGGRNLYRVSHKILPLRQTRECGPRSKEGREDK